MPFPLRWADKSSAASNLVQESPRSMKRSMSTLLGDFTKHGRPPPTSRADVSVKQRDSPLLTFWDWWRYVVFLIVKVMQVSRDLFAYAIHGPPRKSWGLEMTLITSFLRNTNHYSGLLNISSLRALMHIGGFLPLPSDALVTPVTFRVRRRNLRGILSEFDALESGHRELSGEYYKWVVSRHLWNKLQADWKDLQMKAGPPSSRNSKERVVYFLHGGAYFVFSAATHRILTIPLSKALGSRVFAVNYRLAPETRFPGPLHDAVCGYLRLIEDLHIPPENVVLAGDSAGGGLCLALLMYLRDNAYPLPSSAILLSPWVDLTRSCDSWDSNSSFDVIHIPHSGDHLDPVACYLGDEMERYITHPYASPLFGDFHGLPPMLVQAGDAEVLRDEITLLVYKAMKDGVAVHHELYEDGVHVFQMFSFLEMAHKALLACRHFTHKTLPQLQVHSPRSIDSATEATLDTESRSGLAATSASARLLAELSASSSDEESVSVASKRRKRMAGDSIPARAADGISTKELTDTQPTVRRRSLSRILNGLSMTTTQTIPQIIAPPPSIRKRVASHPDMVELVERYNEDGPASHTTTNSPVSPSAVAEKRS